MIRFMDKCFDFLLNLLLIEVACITLACVFVVIVGSL